MNYSYLVHRIHVNTGRQPHNALKDKDIKKIVKFLKRIAEEHGILLPGRTPGVRDYKRSKLLTSSMSKRQIYGMYKASCDEQERIPSESAFKLAWKLYVPHITIMKPMTDLCSTCRKNSRALVRSSNTSLEKQSEVNIMVIND